MLVNPRQKYLSVCLTPKNLLEYILLVVSAIVYSIYIGQTGRNFNIRLKEHARAFNSNWVLYQSTFIHHLKVCNSISSGYAVYSKCLKPLRLEDKGFKVNIFESLKIFNPKPPFRVKNFPLLTLVLNEHKI